MMSKGDTGVSFDNVQKKTISSRVLGKPAFNITIATSSVARLIENSEDDTQKK